ncbi:MAG: SDR family oxidoreductase [Polyangiaceae bacterium]
MSNNGPLLVTGASGHLGRRVVELLASSPQTKGRKLIAVTRSPEKLADFAARGVEVRAGDFDRPATLQAAFAGVERALIISTDALDRPGRRLEQHFAAVNAARSAGVKHVVYTSLTNPDPESAVTLAPDHWGTENAIRESGLGFTVLRNNMYTDYLLMGLPHAVSAGKLVNSYGDGRVSYVTREDCAQAAAAALAASFDGKTVLDISGPAALTQSELASIASEVTGKPVAYLAVSAEVATQNLQGAGLPLPVAQLLVSFETAAKRGQLEVVSAAVRELTGNGPQSVHEFLSAHRAALG